MENSETILNDIYKAYGTDSGILFGIKEKGVVKAIIDFTINRLSSPASIEVKEECVHPWASVLGDGEMQPAKCLQCGKIL